MRILTIDSASGTASAAVFDDDHVCAEAYETMQQGQPAKLPALVAGVVAAAGGGPIDLIAVTVGPGSFTGLRAALAFAHGLAAGWTCPIVGVGIVEALLHDARRAAPKPRPPIWVALNSRAGRVFLECGAGVESRPLDDLPHPGAVPIVTGNAASEVCDRLRARGETSDLVRRDAASPAAIAAIARERHAGARPPLAAQPIYVDAPEAKLPARP